MSHRYPPHLPHFSYIGPYRYSLCFCTHGRIARFTSTLSVNLVRTQIERSSREEATAVIAYCFMPDHLHLLVEETNEHSDLRVFIRKAKQYSGFEYSKQSGARLWQRYGFERTLRNEESTFVVARYILENPLRAGLVTRVEDYPFVGSCIYTLRELLDSVYEVRSG